MSTLNKPVSFDEIINADRQRRKNEALANEIFSKHRRLSTPGGLAGRKPTAAAPSLASRVTKRSVSTGVVPKANVNGHWTHDLHHRTNITNSRVSKAVNTRGGSGRINTEVQRRLANLQKELENDTSQTVSIQPKPKGLSIRGTASGPHVVVASNFAPGTTAADIESAIQPHVVEMSSCRIVSARPTVIAEMVFPDIQDANNVVATFNNQMADGRLLYVYLKDRSTDPALPRQPKVSQASPGRNAQNGNRGGPSIQSGNYGFQDNGGGGQLYSDNIVRKGRGLR